MTNEQALTVLKFAAPIVALFAAVWSTTQKITYDDDNGVKRLTLPGRVMIGIGVVSTLITVLALGLEIYVERDKAAVTQKVKDTEALLAAEEKSRDKASADAIEQRKAVEALATESRIQQGIVHSRILLAETAAAQQRRDAALSLQVAREANRRLDEAQRTLAELDRVNNPLRSIELSVVVALNFDGVDMTRFWAEIAARPDYPRPQPFSRAYRPYELRVAPDELSGREIFDYGIAGARLSLAFVSAGRAAPRAAYAGRLAVVGTDSKGPAAIVVTPRIAGVAVDVRDRTITATYSIEKKLTPEGILEDGTKVSVADVRAMLPRLTVRRVPGNGHVDARPPDRLTRVSVRINDLPYFDASTDQPVDGEVVLELR